MIPKVIHYCWFGKGEYPEVFQKCKDSWKKYCSDYQIIEWNESNFDVNEIPYVREAYKAKKWAFVVDYVRMYVLYTHGGIYLETDTEVIKPLDGLLENDGFVGLAGEVVTMPVLGMTKGHSFGKAMIDYYKDRHFLKEDGSYDQTTINIVANRILEDQFNMTRSQTIQKLKEGLTIYPEKYFFTDWSTGRMKYTNNNYVIHYAEASWQDDQLRTRKMLERKYKRLFGMRVGTTLAFIVSYIKYRGIKRAFTKTIEALLKK